MTVHKGQHLKKWHNMKVGSVDYKKALSTGFAKMTKRAVKDLRRAPANAADLNGLEPAPEDLRDDSSDSSEEPVLLKYMGPEDVTYKKWQRLIPAGFAPCELKSNLRISFIYTGYRSNNDNQAVHGFEGVYNDAEEQSIKTYRSMETG